MFKLAEDYNKLADRAEQRAKPLAGQQVTPVRDQQPEA